MKLVALPLALMIVTLLTACGGAGSNGGGTAAVGTTGGTSGGTTSGGTSGGTTTGSSTGGTTGGSTGSTTGGTTGGSTGGTTGGATGGTTGGGTTGGTTGSTTGGTTGTTTGGTTGGVSAAARLAAKLGRPNRFLVGLGTGNEIADIQSQALHPDIYDRYLTDNSGGSWINYNSPPGAYVDIVASAADSIGAVPMFTLYQFAINGDGNLSVLNSQSQMQTYWQHVVLLFQRLAAYNKPAIVNFEPDFWGYAEQQSGSDATGFLPSSMSIPALCRSVRGCRTT